jgi:two-component system, chemotaxis family, protein-glutamate methylesterase/glutaminase
MAKRRLRMWPPRENEAMAKSYPMDEPFALSCPECGGTTRHEATEGFVQYRCHIGHVLSAETMLYAQRHMLEHRLGACVAQLNERAELCRQQIERARQRGDEYPLLEAARDEALKRAELLCSLLEDEWVLPEGDIPK